MGAGNGARPARGLQGVTVLAVEDVGLDLKLMRILLQRAGAEVRLAFDVASAAAELQRERPQALVLDIMLPGGDSLALVRRVKLTGPPIAILAVSASNHAAEALDAGCDQFLAKPIDVDTFADTVARLVERVRNAAPR